MNLYEYIDERECEGCYLSTAWISRIRRKDREIWVVRLPLYGFEYAIEYDKPVWCRRVLVIDLGINGKTSLFWSPVL